MQMKWRILTLVVVALAVCAGKTRSEIIAVQISGELTYISPVGDWINDNFNIGDVITGRYVYDTSTPDSSGSLDSGHYWHYTDPYGIYLNIGDIVVQTDPDNVEFFMSMVNTDLDDYYVIASFTNLAAANGPPVSRIGWQLDDRSATALSSDDLLPTPPVLDDWGSILGLTVEFGERGGSLIRGHATSAERVPYEGVPEPGTLFLLGFGVAILLKRGKA